MAFQALPRPFGLQDPSRGTRQSLQNDSMLSAQSLASLYRDAHNLMRNTDGLQPQEAFEELLKYLFFRQNHASSAAQPHTADTLRRGFAACVKALHGQGSAHELWRDRKFRLSDAALLSLHGLFAGIVFSSISFDVWSAALRMFLSPDLRRGLGIYLTPDAVVQAIVEAVAPPHDVVVYDPACGSGTFLIETLRFWRAAQPRARARSTAQPTEPRELCVLGSDINARMLLLAELSLGQMPSATFVHKTLDALTHPTAAATCELTSRRHTARALTSTSRQQLSAGRSQLRVLDTVWPQPNSVDLILTNPPFGTYIEPQAVAAQQFTTLASTERSTPSRMQSEVLFIEQCLRWLRPEGLLAIVVPRSVVTNASLSRARKAIDRLAILTGMLTLPPETFAATGTQTTTCVLFLRKRSREDVDAAATADDDAQIHADLIRVPVIDIDNVGVDLTGRARAGSQLTQAARDLKRSLVTGRAIGLARHVRVPRARSLSSVLHAATSTTTRAPRKKQQRLADVVELAQTGRTPARAAYTAGGIFTLKVGNLTGQGIDWTPRDRNYVAPHFVSDALYLRDGDIVLTASAHNPRYIAQKVDIVHAIPEFVGGRATFVGEVLRLRVKPDAMSPFELLAMLRTPATRAAIQSLIRGQTAHLRPKDLLELPLPHKAASPRLVELLKREADLARELNLIVAGQRELLGKAP